MNLSYPSPRLDECPAQDPAPASCGGRGACAQGRITMSFLTAFTPGVLRAISAARLRSAVLLAKPDNCTVPLSVSTLIDMALTVGSSANLALTRVVMVASSTYSPTVDWSRVTAQPTAVKASRPERARVAAVRSEERRGGKEGRDLE